MNWRLVGGALLLVLLALLAGLVHWQPKWPDIHECRRLYTKAHSATDTAQIDRTIPLAVNPKFASQQVTCGTLRRLGRLE